MAQHKSIGFCSSESGVVLIGDPTLLAPYLKPGALETIVANALEAFEEGVHDVVLGEAGGEAIAVAVEGKFVFVKQLERIDEALVLDENLPRDAR